MSRPLALTRVCSSTWSGLGLGLGSGLGSGLGLGLGLGFRLGLGLGLGLTSAWLTVSPVAPAPSTMLLRGDSTSRPAM